MVGFMSPMSSPQVQSCSPILHILPALVWAGTGAGSAGLGAASWVSAGAGGAFTWRGEKLQGNSISIFVSWRPGEPWLGLGLWCVAVQGMKCLGADVPVPGRS